MVDLRLNCPLCDAPLKQVEEKDEEIYLSIPCNECEDYHAEIYDKKVEKEVLEVGNYQIWLQHAQNQTLILRVHQHERDWDSKWTEHLITLPLLTSIPSMNELHQKIKLWLTFS